MAITNKVGPPVTGDDFYGRTEELSRAIKYLDTNHSLVLSAPRRIGKTSFAKRLLEENNPRGGNVSISILKEYARRMNSCKYS